MKKEKLFILSDLHLEYQSGEKKAFVLNTINERIEATRKEGFEPVIAFAGDVDNGIKSYDFIGQVNCPVVYVAGNHEFWKGDYYETVQALKLHAPSNARFLHNDIAVLKEHIILGSTLWTDIGVELNPDMFIHASSRMNDMAYIKAAAWYENAGNIAKLRESYKALNIEEKIENKNWNGLIQIEENRKAWMFLASCSDVLELLKKSSCIREDAQKDVKSKYDWRRIENAHLAHIKSQTDFSGPELSWEGFVNQLSLLSSNYKISQADKTRMLQGNIAQKDEIFQKLRKVGHVQDKDIVVMSHHLPFYEEALVGTVMSCNKRQSITTVNPVNEKIFLIRQGQNYPWQNYFYGTRKGEIERHNDITHIVNYHNNGACKLPEFLQQTASLWIHGHEHNFNYCDYVKGMQIVTSPVASSLGVFDFSSPGSPVINHTYLKYHQVAPQDYAQEFEKLKNALVRPAAGKLSKQQLRERVMTWALKHYDWESHLHVLQQIEKSANEIVLACMKWINMDTSQNGDKEPATRQVKDLESKIMMFCDAYNYNSERLKKLHNGLALSYKVRTKENFNFQDFSTGCEENEENFFSWTMGNANFIERIPDQVIGLYTAEKAFEAKENVKIALKYHAKIKNLLDNMKFHHVYQVQEQDCQPLIKLISGLDAYEVQKKVAQKWQWFYDRTQGNAEQKRDSFNF